MNKLFLLVLLVGCGMEHRVSGEVDVNLNIDYTMLREACKAELGLGGLENSELLPEEVQELNACVGKKYLDLMESLEVLSEIDL